MFFSHASLGSALSGPSLVLCVRNHVTALVDSFKCWEVNLSPAVRKRSASCAETISPLSLSQGCECMICGRLNRSGINLRNVIWEKWEKALREYWVAAAVEEKGRRNVRVLLEWIITIATPYQCRNCVQLSTYEAVPALLSTFVMHVEACIAWAAHQH